MNDFEIGGRKFKCLKINAFKQFHVVRRIGPILGDLLPAMKKIAGKSKSVKGLDEVVSGLTEEQKLEQLSEFATPIMNGLSKLNDEDAEYVLFALLSGIEMQGPGGAWLRVVQGEPPMLMVQDMELPVMMQLAGKAFGFNLASFFTVLPRQ